MRATPPHPQRVFMQQRRDPPTRWTDGGHAATSPARSSSTRDGIPIRRWRTAWRTACQAAGVPTRFLHDCRRRRRPHPDPRQRARPGRHTPDRAQKPGDLRPRHHHPRTGTARRRRLARRVSGAADAGGARAGGRRWPDTARLCAAARAQATRTGRPATAAHVATWRADAAKHGHPPDGSVSATPGRGAQGVPPAAARRPSWVHRRHDRPAP